MKTINVPDTVSGAFVVNAVNDKSYTREKFRGLIEFVIMLGKLSRFCFYMLI